MPERGELLHIDGPASGSSIDDSQHALTRDDPVIAIDRDSVEIGAGSDDLPRFVSTVPEDVVVAVSQLLVQQ